MNVHCTATVVHTSLEIYWTTVGELFCLHCTDSLHFNIYVTPFLAGKGLDQTMSSGQDIANKLLTSKIKLAMFWLKST